MKKIIDNKLYDTDKCEVIYGFRRNYPTKIIFYENLYHNNYCESQILQTTKGTYLEYCAEKKVLKIIGVREVMELIKNLNPDKYIELFGEVEEG